MWIFKAESSCPVASIRRIPVLDSAGWRPTGQSVMRMGLQHWSQQCKELAQSSPPLPSYLSSSGKSHTCMFLQRTTLVAESVHKKHECQRDGLGIGLVYPPSPPTPALSVSLKRERDLVRSQVQTRIQSSWLHVQGKFIYIWKFLERRIRLKTGDFLFISASCTMPSATPLPDMYAQ